MWPRAAEGWCLAYARSSRPSSSAPRRAAGEAMKLLRWLFMTAATLDEVDDAVNQTVCTGGAGFLRRRRSAPTGPVSEYRKKTRKKINGGSIEKSASTTITNTM